MTGGLYSGTHDPAGVPGGNLAARERLVTPKGNPPKAAPPKRVSKTTYPATSGMGALAAKTGGSYAFDRPPQRPEDIKVLQHAVKDNPGVRAIAEMTRDPLGLIQAGGAIKDVVKHPGVGTGVAAGISVAGLALPGIRKAKIVEEAPILRAVKSLNVKLKPDEAKALQVVHEGVPIEKRIADQKALVKAATSKSEAKVAQKELSSLQAASKHVHDVSAPHTIKAGTESPYVANGFEGVDDIPDHGKPYEYSYHRTSIEKFKEIREQGLKSVAPGVHAHKVTDEQGVYFAGDPLRARNLSGKASKGSIFLRVKRDSLRDVSERVYGEHLTPHSVPAGSLEYLGADKKWHPLADTSVERSMPRLLPGRHKLIETYAKAEKSLEKNPSTSAEIVKGALPGMKIARGKQKALYAEERAARFAQVRQHLANTDLSPDERMQLAKNALRGELPKVNYKGFSELTDEAATQMRNEIHAHPNLTDGQKISLDEAIVGAQHGVTPQPRQIALLEHVFGKATASGLRESTKSWHDTLLNVLNIPRSLQSTADVSGLLRQSLVGATTHPVIFGKEAVPATFKSLVSDKYFKNLQEGILKDPDFPLADAAGIQFTEAGAHATVAKHEEAFASEYAAKIPVLGHVVKGSARAYTGGQNQLRMQLFKHMLRIRQSAGLDVNDEKWLKSIGDVVNAATGRGTLPARADHILPAMNTVFYSPRLILSRINYLDPTWYVRLHSKQARIEALKGLFATAGYVGAMLYAFSRIPGVKVGSLDPRSSDFGKLKVGNTRYDVAGGFQQYVRIASEIATNTKVSSTTNKTVKLGSGYGVPNAWDELGNFLVNKTSPVVSTGINLVRRQDAVGNPVNLPGQGKKTLGVRFGTLLPNEFVPLVAQDAKDLYREKHGGLNGIEWAMAGYGISGLGVGVQTYGPKKTTPKGGSSKSNLPGLYDGSSSSGASSPGLYTGGTDFPSGGGGLYSQSP